MWCSAFGRHGHGRARPAAPVPSPKAWGLTTLFLGPRWPRASPACSLLLELPRFRLGHGLGVASLLVFADAAGALAPWAGRPVAGDLVAGAATCSTSSLVAVMQAFAVGFCARCRRRAWARHCSSRICCAGGLRVAASTRSPTFSPAGARRSRPRPLRIADRWNESNALPPMTSRPRRPATRQRTCRPSTDMRPSTGLPAAAATVDPCRDASPHRGRCASMCL